MSDGKDWQQIDDGAGHAHLWRVTEHVIAAARAKHMKNGCRARLGRNRKSETDARNSIDIAKRNLAPIWMQGEVLTKPVEDAAG